MFDPSQPARDAWVLKGGYALEMRFHMARSTKDLVDLVLILEERQPSIERVRQAVAVSRGF
jgi:hypothetical protein